MDFHVHCWPTEVAFRGSEERPEGLSGILGYKAYLPRGVRFLGERCFLGNSSLGTAEAEALGHGYFESTLVCRCFCIYFVCFSDRVSPILRVLHSRAVHSSTRPSIDPSSPPS